MTTSSTPSRLPLNAEHVRRQFSRRGDLSDAQFLYGEVARRMDERLRLVRLTPDQILDAGCGAGTQLSLLHARYPLARILGQDHNPGLLKLAQQRAKKIFPHGWREWLSRLRGHPPATAWIQTDLAHSGLQPESIDLVWSNLALHWHPAPHEVLQEWGRIIRPNGLVFFSCFGPATMQELREALTTAGLTTATPNFVDMHDFGDLLIEKGFADPVMDQEVLTLTYPSAEKLLQDVKNLGGNPALGRRAGLATRQWRQRLLDALALQRQPDGRIHLTIEVAYGHAWRSAIRRGQSGETRISVSAIQRKSTEK
ncbi:methyltransferase domain-containing protein [Zwartia panacis]|uniref:methyltransferase domain-containing protein n=1 Tax=Zwartia panacis TaxID=2683345 RepID=UPI0025B2C2D5|nr:methyltransferase domain-containing protein [Zwartia panacis]MDN4017210.1 methyltransferase domain-containing protein [Zwartia panacis]